MLSFLLVYDEKTNPDHTKTPTDPPTISPVTAMPVAAGPAPVTAMVMVPAPVTPVPVPVPVVAPAHFLGFEAIDVFLGGNGGFRAGPLRGRSGRAR